MESIGFMLGVVSIAVTAVRYIYTADFLYRHSRWGLVGHVLAVLWIVDVQGIRRLHWNINIWADDEVMAWKDSYMSTCSAIQVAGAIFASVGLTALQLPNMDSTHWSARALLTCSMILGVLSVVFASSQQQNIGILNNALEIRLWLSRGKLEIEKRRYKKPFKLLPLESSVSALKQFYMPKVILNLAVLLYTIGFGIYLLYSWLYRVEINGGLNDFRNIFIAFVATVGLVCVYQIILRAFSYADEWKRTKDFDLDNSQGFAKPASRRQLEEWLKALQDMQNLDIEDKEEYSVLKTVVNDLQAKWEAERAAREAREDAARKEQRKR